MEAEQKVATVQLSVRLRGVSPPVTASTAGSGTDLAGRVARGAASRLRLERWAPVYLQIRWWRFGDPARASRSANPFSIDTNCSSRGRLAAASKREV